MHLRRLVKGNALRALRRHWSRAAAISLILMILSQFFVSLEFLLSVIFDIPDFADPLRTPQARALGFRHDGSAAALLRNALDLAPRRSRAAARKGVSA